jgi:uncharacterized protein
LTGSKILNKIYSEICIPTAVYNEIEAGRDKPFYRDLSKIDWIKIIEIKNQNALKYFLDLDSGEAEAIVLATEIKADLIIMDEKLGRFHAKHADLKVTGIIGVLIKAKQQGIITEIKPLLSELIEKNIWIGDKLMNEILAQTGEL